MLNKNELVIYPDTCGNTQKCTYFIASHRSHWIDAWLSQDKIQALRENKRWKVTEA